MLVNTQQWVITSIPLANIGIYFPSCLQVATPLEFIRRYGGERAIDKILISNNGIAAVKAMRSIRRWAYEVFRNETTIKFVVMVTPEDLAANAEFIRMADHCVSVPGIGLCC